REVYRNPGAIDRVAGASPARVTAGRDQRSRQDLGERRNPYRKKSLESDGLVSRWSGGAGSEQVHPVEPGGTVHAADMDDAALTIAQRHSAGAVAGLGKGRGCFYVRNGRRGLDTGARGLRR